MTIDALLAVFEGLITPLYLLFAGQVAYQANRLRTEIDTRKALALVWLVAVFILCAFAGYLSSMMDWSASVRVWIHGPLVLATVALVVSNTAKVFAEMLKRG